LLFQSAHAEIKAPHRRPKSGLPSQRMKPRRVAVAKDFSGARLRPEGV
jgi:hypothetical protein